MTTPSLPPAGWYPDPWSHAAVRWFDGSIWTPHLSNDRGWYPDPYRQARLRWFDGMSWTGAVHDPFPPPAPTVAHEPEPPTAATTSRLTESAVRAGTLARLLGTGQALAVLDVETTGLGTYDRITEIGIVTVDASGTIIAELDTLVNPRRDVGPTWLHGITASMVTDAPEFGDVAEVIAERLHGHVVVGHNVAFDTRMVGRELNAAGIAIDWGASLDTLAVTRAKLGIACTDYGIALDDAHCAINDARATARLLERTATLFHSAGSPAYAGGFTIGGYAPLLPRAGASVDQARPYVASLAEGMRVEADVSSYAILLDRALEDLRLTSEEKAELAALADDLGMSATQVARAHRKFLDHVLDTALDDGVITDEEMDQLLRVAAVLDIDPHVVHEKTNRYRSEEVSVSIWPGIAVCFTGDGGVDSMGVIVPRDNLVSAAIARNVTVVDAVRAKGCDLLVAADTASMSHKAKAAHKFGIPIVTVEDFLTGIDDRVPVTGTRVLSAGVASVCQECGVSWVAARRAKKCGDCRRSGR